MPRQSSYFIRLSLIWFGLGFVLGGLMLTQKGISYYSGILVFVDLHIQYVMVGWILNLVMGVIYWMFPRFNPEKDEEAIRGPAWACWGAMIALNLGLVVATVGTVAADRMYSPSVAYALYVLGVLLFVRNAWPRIKPHR